MDEKEYEGKHIFEVCSNKDRGKDTNVDIDKHADRDDVEKRSMAAMSDSLHPPSPFLLIMNLPHDVTIPELVKLIHTQVGCPYLGTMHSYIYICVRDGGGIKK